MAPSYHLAPNFRTVPPPNGPLKLGTLVTDLKTYEPINQDVRVDLPEGGIQSFHVEGFTATRARMLNGQMGIWAKFVAIEGIGAEISLSAEGNDEIEFNFEGLDTIEFNPTRDYMAKTMQLAEVKDYFDYCRSKPPVFLVTGLMIARNPSVTIRRRKGLKAVAEIEINPPNAVEVGARASFQSETSQSISVTKSDDFVVGMRLRRLLYRRTILEGVLGKDGRLINEAENQGALLGADKAKADIDDVEDEEVNEGDKGAVMVTETDSARELNWIVPRSE